MLLLAEVGYRFEDVWPTIEESWIEAIRAKDWDKFAPQQQKDANTVVVLAHAEESQDPGVSDEAGLVVEKLKRKSKWGVACVTTEAMQKMTHLDHGKLDMAIRELLGMRLLIQNERSGAYSLDPGRQFEIERIAEIMVERTPRR